MKLTHRMCTASMQYKCLYFKIISHWPSKLSSNETSRPLGQQDNLSSLRHYWKKCKQKCQNNEWLDEKKRQWNILITGSWLDGTIVQSLLFDNRFYFRGHARHVTAIVTNPFSMPRRSSREFLENKQGNYFQNKRKQTTKTTTKDVEEIMID